MSRRRRIVVCPKCGFRFDVGYARVYACGTCPSAVSCDHVKCPQCNHEFPTRPSVDGRTRL
ncbi:MAG: hypothetical protein JSV58_03800 [Candidatus Bathyarchaeota archaeon]|nr:MAG: hypothetical protein JSV58_03800 [Candidatus Bathyarchaeota archaeon]